MATVFGLVHAPVSQPGHDPFAPQGPAAASAPTPAAPSPAAQRSAASASYIDDPFEARRSRPASSPYASPRPAPGAPDARAADEAFARGQRPPTGPYPGEPGRVSGINRPYVDPARSAARPLSTPGTERPLAVGASPPSPSTQPGFGYASERDRFTAQFAVAASPQPTAAPAAQGWGQPGQRPISQSFGLGAAGSSAGFDPAQRSPSTRPGVTTTPSGFDPHQLGRPASSVGAELFRAPRTSSGLGSDIFDAHPRFAQHASRDTPGPGRPNRGPTASPVQATDEDFLAALRGVAVQSALQDGEVRGLAQLAWRWQLGSGETLYGEGDPIAAAFLMGEGIMRLESAAPDGSPRPIGALKLGDWGGEAAWTGGGAHGTAAVAATDATVFAFDMARIQQIIQVQPGLCVRLLAAIAGQQARRQRNAVQRVDQFCQLALPRPAEPAPEPSAPSGLGRFLSKLTGSKEEP